MHRACRDEVQGDYFKNTFQVVAYFIFSGYFATLPVSRAGLSNSAPVAYFPGALIYSAGFNVNQNFKKKIFLNNSMFQFYRSTAMNTVFPL
jgi:hypothetical protein